MVRSCQVVEDQKRGSAISGHKSFSMDSGLSSPSLYPTAY